ncbi:hypothetical protein D0T53_13235 [Dysgonomonas sp. 216]|uniref:hypothetical protein n=1 Tax=Dysgonomonas sp. 216 TaxID=2302934 RepID=UPI0013D560DD|nr:hypothetical protein [Dysgonomonas sp. 216]NDW19862.1 hypothetical protein [Dysgonomonas sp. 216]
MSLQGIDFNNLPIDPETSQKIIDKTFENQNKDKELGKLGKFFGCGDSVKMNIAGLTIFILLIAGIGYTIAIFFSDPGTNKNLIGIVDFWGIITPIITLALGYIFGKSKSNTE